MSWIIGLLTGKLGPWLIGAAAVGLVFLWGNRGWNNYRAAQREIVALKGAIKGLETKISVLEKWADIDVGAANEVIKIEKAYRCYLAGYFGKPLTDECRKLLQGVRMPKAPDVRPAGASPGPAN